MKTRIQFFFIAFLAMLSSVHAQTVLSVDFGDRTSAATLEPNFNLFLISSNTSATAIQTAPTIRTFDTLTVTVSGGGSNPGYDDRLRTTPTNQDANGNFTQELLLRDFIFATNGTGTGGLDVKVDGLAPNQIYAVTLWSYDSGSPGNRVSDWYAQGYKVVSGYTFAGSTTVMPTSDTQYQMNFTTMSDDNGSLLVQGRRVSGAPSVFLNGIRISVGVGDPPAITRDPSPSEVFAGDHAVFRTTYSGLPPIACQWQKGGVDILDATNSTLVVSNAQAGDAGTYSMIARSLMGFGSATSAPAALVVMPVSNLYAGQLACWPLDAITNEYTPDTTTNQFHLFATNLTSADIVAGPHGGAIQFNGSNAFVMRNDALGSVPVNQYPAYTVALWVKGQGTNQSDKRVFAISSSTNNNPMVTLGTGVSGNTNSVDLYIRNNDGGSPLNHPKTTLPVFDDSWHHVAWVDNNGYGSFYVDGVLDTNVFNYSRGTLTPNVTCLGAVYRTNAAALFLGAIDDAAVWRRALSQAEIQFVITNGAAPLIESVRIDAIQVGNGNVTLTLVTTSPAKPFHVWESSSLPPATWDEVPDVNYSIPAGNVVFATFAVPSGGQKFYRVSQ